MQSICYGKPSVLVPIPSHTEQINNAKKAFSAVTKVASGVSKGRKAPKSGIRRKLHTAIAKILPKKKKTAPKRKKINITVNR